MEHHNRQSNRAGFSPFFSQLRKPRRGISIRVFAQSLNIRQVTVWLLWRNINSTHLPGKLDFKRLGPFCVNMTPGKDVYFLILPNNLSRIHPVFHTSLLLHFVKPRSFSFRMCTHQGVLLP
ncbi:gag-pol polyprotein [Puccinia sorghi]|uniref:Gag-pol polyprotein n=1 Tax=Puccinia sorghi TaxID=27349 RepID=A0A0L6V8Y1_9BASI|nr:gag-pol polyprotein [Puccinia sorghi]